MQNSDYLIIGAGIVGLAIAYQLKTQSPNLKIQIIEKEDDIARHASGRNSGVLHAGFYYTANTLKARLTAEGNRRMKAYCQEKGIPLNECGKLVVVQNEQELKALHELYQRGLTNGVNIHLISEKEAHAIDPNAKTFQQALYSPDTASVNPLQVCQQLKTELQKMGVIFNFQTAYTSHNKNRIHTTQGMFNTTHIVNCAGLYADRIAQDFGFASAYTIIPFKGLYLKYDRDKTCIKTNIYPVPNLKYPFLGVHYTKTVDNSIKIGPTAIPAFWRENYQGWSHFKFKEFCEILYYETRLFMGNSFGFRDLAFEETKKYKRNYLIALAAKMVKQIDPQGFGDFLRPGIRAQLLNTDTLELVQDFVIEGDANSTHILNAVSPAFTCAFSFADLVIETISK